jgi:hypothetical protein
METQKISAYEEIIGINYSQQLTYEDIKPDGLYSELENSDYIISLTKEDGKKWWRALDLVDRGNVMEDVYYKQPLLRELVSHVGIKYMELMADEFCEHYFFIMVLDIVNAVRRDIRREKMIKKVKELNLNEKQKQNK